MLNFSIFLTHSLACLLLVIGLDFGVHAKTVKNGNNAISDFDEAKRLLSGIHERYPYTLYCNCKYDRKRVDLQSCGYKIQKDARRAVRLEWEHVVPAENFGKSFVEWREGAPHCRKKGRKCAGTNPEFSRMEADLYNLWPEIGELNGLRSNYSMAALTSSKYDFGGCKAKIDDRKFEPMDSAKGVVARVYMYMDKEYPEHGIISDKNKKLFDAWDKMFPVTKWECERARIIHRIQGNENKILKERCPEFL